MSRLTAMRYVTEELCGFGCGQIAKYINKSKRLLCAKTHNACPEMKRKNAENKKGINPFLNRPHPRGALGKTPWNFGLTATTDDRIKLAAEVFKKKILNGEYVPKGTPHTDEFKKEQSIRKNKLYASGWEPTCGRCKKYDYLSPIAGQIKVDGTWELKVAVYLDKLNVTWERNRKRFGYIKPNGKEGTYQPDFYVKEWDSFIEVKGYETELDRAKWKQFPHTLLIWRKDKIKTLET